jgi:hypothetical protein
MQAAAPVVDEYIPPEHFVHCPAPEIGETLPAAQNEQLAELVAPIPAE